MNSSFHGSAVTQRASYLNPTRNNSLLNKPPPIFIEGRSMHKLSDRQKRFVQTERDRYVTPYPIKPWKKKKKTVFTPTVDVPIHPTSVQVAEGRYETVIVPPAVAYKNHLLSPYQ